MLLSKITKAIVVPFDFSELSIEALRRAVEMAEDPSLIRVIYVSDYPSAYEYGVAFETISQENILKKIRDSFAKANSDTGEIPQLNFTAVFGNPGQEITRFAEEVEADLIVMASHGRSGFVRFLLGSVAEKVLRLASCPVLVLRDLVADEIEGANSNERKEVLADR